MAEAGPPSPSGIPGKGSLFDSPGEEGIVFDIKKFSIHDGPGIRTTVFLKGCPLACAWCHNPESQPVLPVVVQSQTKCLKCGRCLESCPNAAIIKTKEGFQTVGSRCLRCGNCSDACPSEARQLVGRKMSVGEILKEVLKDRIFYDESNGGVTASGGEPLMQPEFLIRLLRACKAEGLHTAVDTSGWADPQNLLQVALYTDLFLYDLKIMDPLRHMEMTGVGNQVILSNLTTLAQRGAPLLIRIPLVPGVNDDTGNINATALFLKALPGSWKIQLLPYHRAAEEKHGRFGLTYRLKGTPVVPAVQLSRIASQFESFGLKVIGLDSSP